MSQTMFSHEARSISAGLGALAGTVNEDAWLLIKQARTNLDALAVQLTEFEARPVHMPLNGTITDGKVFHKMSHAHPKGGCCHE